ncbi:hypothetical protein DCAR_0935491 [Daucus carota subsp. sativus]|uniref:Uncharacterized protein n=1 Tax=Daucus carota subsp. sativus TaxID=79200 RepID=A0A175YH81_DAUCS|nr:hypothetical protein DCAR_0935491 [Daucus carota subsp. sativus]
MRGRLRVVGGDGGENTSWAEVPAEYWSLVAGDGAIPVIHQPSTPLKIDDERNKQEGETTAAAHRIVKWPIANNKAHEQQTSAGPSNPSAASKTNPPASSNASANVPSKTTTSHGGIIRPLKPPAAISRQNPLGVKPIPGQKFTSLKNLEAAKTKMQKNMGKKN